MIKSKGYILYESEIISVIKRYKYLNYKRLVMKDYYNYYVSKEMSKEALKYKNEYDDYTQKLNLIIDFYEDELDKYDVETDIYVDENSEIVKKTPVSHNTLNDELSDDDGYSSEYDNKEPECELYKDINYDELWKDVYKKKFSKYYV